MVADWYPIEQVREEFPALQRIENNHFVAYFDGPGGTQVARSVIDAMATYMKNGVANLGATSPTSKETSMIVEEAREHVATLLGTKKQNIVFGANMTSLAFKIARDISRYWDNGNIVVTLEYGNFYAKTLVEKLQVKNGGLIRAGIAPYNTIGEIDHLIEALNELN